MISILKFKVILNCNYIYFKVDKFKKLRIIINFIYFSLRIVTIIFIYFSLRTVINFVYNV